MVGAGKVGLARQPLGATMVIGRIRPALTGMWPCTSVSSSTERMVSQIAMSAVPSSGMLIGRSGTCGAVPVRSTVRLVVLLGDGDDDRQFLLAGIVAVEIAVDRRLGAIDAVGQLGDRLAHQPLGVIHQRVAGRDRRCRAHSGRPARPCARRRCGAAATWASMSPTTRSEARILSRSDLPDRVVAHAAVVDLDRLELQALGIGVDRLDDAARARRQRADIEMMRGGGGESRPARPARTPAR